MMQQPQFWNLGSPESTRRLAEWAHGEVELSEPKICPIEGPVATTKRLTDLNITLPGHTIEDFVWTWYSDCLLTDRVLELFKSSGFTGFEVKPVKAVFAKAKETPPRLWELDVTGSAGMAPPESGVKVVWQCEACGRKKHSVPTNLDKLIKPSQWDGSDFFIIRPLSAFIFVTERVAQVIRDNRLTGAVLIRPKDIRIPFDTC
jgi:hypothetical protein